MAFRHKNSGYWMFPQWIVIFGAIRPPEIVRLPMAADHRIPGIGSCCAAGRLSVAGATSVEATEIRLPLLQEGGERLFRLGGFQLGAEGLDLLKQRGVLTQEQIHALAHKGKKADCHTDKVADKEEAKLVQINTLKAHGLVPAFVERVTDGAEAAIKSKGNLYFDVHHLGAGKVTAEDVAGAHVKDLAVQDKYGVNFINYWVDPKLGVVMCLAEAPDSISMVKTHKEAHGLVPDEVHLVKQGN